MSGDDQRQDAIRRHVRGAAIAGALGHAAWSALLLYGIYAGEPRVLKVAAYMLIGWLPVGILMTWGELDETWGKDTAVWPYVGMFAVMAGLAALAWYLP